MNTQDKTILTEILNYPGMTQRNIAEQSGYSLGAVNISLKRLRDSGHVDQHNQPRANALKLQNAHSPRNAIILAAGMGMRMAPINQEAPKPLLNVKGEVLIERLISQLNEVGISDVTVVAGFMVDKFEYLLDKYHINIIFNPDYSVKNNLHSLNKVKSLIKNTYIIPGDIYFHENPFRRSEIFSWYMVSGTTNVESNVRLGKSKNLIKTMQGESGNHMVGVAYLTSPEADVVKERLAKLADNHTYDKSFWEETLFNNTEFILPARVTSEHMATEINTYEQLREFDNDSNNLHSDELTTISKVFSVPTDNIRNIEVLKKGMTNRSFLFTINEQKYIMRVPGEGTEKLIDRSKEAEVYKVIAGKGLCDDVVYLDPIKGYKITKFLDDIRTADPDNEEDLIKCMELLHKFHDMKLNVEPEFDLYERILFYESLWNGELSIYEDYQDIKEQLFSLKPWIDSLDHKRVLTHIDAVSDNFLFYHDVDGIEKLQLTDWEYAGMQDPHVDLAMFSVYSYYSKEQIDRLIDFYFKNSVDEIVRIKIYAYVALCGLLWSNWSEYKRHLGIEFGDYGFKQYRYAKDYFRLVKTELKKRGVNLNEYS